LKYICEKKVLLNAEIAKGMATGCSVGPADVILADEAKKVCRGYCDMLSHYQLSEAIPAHPQLQLV